MDERRSVLYLVSRFPVETETFIVNEWWAVSTRFNLELTSLLRSRRPPISPASARLLPRVRFAALGPSALLANLSLLLRHPQKFLGVLAAVVRGSRNRPAGGVVKGLVVFAKAVWIAKRASDGSIGHVHAHFANHPTTAAWIVHRLTGLPFSFTTHANDLFRGPALLEEKVRDAAFVNATSDHNRLFIRKRVPNAGRIEIIHYGVDPERFSPRAKESDALSRLICVGSFQPKKAQADLVRAFATLVPDFPTLSLDLVGHGPEHENVERLAESLGVHGWLRMWGWLSPEGVSERLAACGLFVLPSVRLPSGRMEGVPNVLIEAMASGLAVIATDISGIPELVIDGETGVLVPPGMPDRLAAAIRRLLRDPALAARLGERARQHVVERYNVHTETARLGDLFDASLAGRSPAGVA